MRRAELLTELYDSGYKHVFGNDIERPKSLPSYIQFFEGAFNQENLSEKQFDFISLFHVFEHIPEPKLVLSNIDPILSTEGFLYITIPNVRSRQFDKFGPNCFHLDPPRHLHLIPPHELVKHIENMGYRLIFALSIIIPPAAIKPLTLLDDVFTSVVNKV